MDREVCPACGEHTLDLGRYREMMVLSANKALFHLVCPACGTHSASMYRIPDALLDTVRTEAARLGAGMGRDA